MITNAYLVNNLQSLAAANREAFPHLKTLRSSPIDTSEGIILCNVRDEAELLPHFLKHRREIGVKTFAFVDNGSTDQTLPLLLDQKDCDVFQFTGGFRNSWSGMVWKNLLMLTYKSAKWFLSADADEHAVYDGWPGIGLDEFAHAMSLKGRSAVTALMVDMYSKGPISEARIEPSRGFLETCPLFDGEGYKIVMPENWRADNFPKLDALGGPMRRVFGGKDKLGWLAKTPLILEPNIYFHSPHSVLPVGLNFTPMEIALLHFRFSATVIQKIARVLDHRQHAESSISHYEKLGLRIKDDPNFSFLYPGSVKFKTPQQFIEKSMIGSDNLTR
jgi:Glycosyl transferase family 2